MATFLREIPGRLVTGVDGLLFIFAEKIAVHAPKHTGPPSPERAREAGDSEAGKGLGFSQPLPVVAM
ncbi:MAG: hypothetical protein ACLFWL_08190, partial [Candidatus Brocadiia bacterium]